MTERTAERMQQMIKFAHARTLEFVDELNHADSVDKVPAMARRHAEETASWHAVMARMTEPGTTLWPDAYDELAMSGETCNGYAFGVRWHNGRWNVHS